MTDNFAIPYGYNASRASFPSYSDNRHLCTIGTTRSGKGATTIIQALLQLPHSMVIIDPKGQNAAITARHRRAMGQDVFVLNPFGLHTSAPWHLPRHRYNPLAHLNIYEPSVVADASAFAQALIITQGRDPYFDDTARDLIRTCILYLVSTLGKTATLGHVRNMVTEIAARGNTSARLLVAMSKSPHSFISQPIARFMDNDARDISSAINTAITQTGFLDDPALCDLKGMGAFSGSDFDLTQLKRKPTTVYLILPGNLMQPYARFLRILVTAAIERVTSAPGGHPVLLLLDEFARLEALPAISSAFSYSAGFNLQLWPFLQDLGQLVDLYGKQWTSVLANCGMVQFFTPSDMTTAEFIQRRGGMRTGETRSLNYSKRLISVERSESRSETRMPLLPLEETMSLPKQKSIVFFAGKHEPLICDRENYWSIPRLRGMFDVDPFHM